MPAAKQAAYRQRQRNKLGEAEYKKQEAEKRKVRRQRKKAEAAAIEAREEKSSIVEEKSSVPDEVKGPPDEPEDPYVAELEALVQILEIEIDNAKTKRAPKVEVNVSAVEKKIKKLKKIKNAADCNDLLQKVHEAKLALRAMQGKKPIKINSTKQQFDKTTNIIKGLSGVKQTDCGLKEFEILKDTDRVVKYVNKRWKTPNSRNSQLQALSSILSVLHSFDKAYEFYSKLSSSNRVIIDEIGLENLKSEKEKKNWMPYKQLRSIINDVPDDQLRDRALMAIYVLMPPRRAEDVSLLRLNSNAPGTNSYNQDEGRIIYRKYKNDQVYGDQNVPITARAQGILDAYVNGIDLQDGQLLFPSRNSEPYKAFGPVVTRLFKKYVPDSHITTTLIRHIFVSHLHERKNMSLKKKQRIALQMGHSLQMQGVYNRIEEEEEEEKE